MPQIEQNSFLIEAQQQLIAPPGISMDRLAAAVANQIASTIIHEAAHGERWAQQYLTGQMSLNEMNRGEEENIAEQAEQRANLSTDLPDDIFDDSTDTSELSPDMLLDQAIQIANANNNFYIPRNSVVNVQLGPEAWGEFEMVQGPGMEIDEDTTVAWDHNNRKLLVDVESIIAEYNRAISMSQNNQNRPDFHNQHPSAPDSSNQTELSFIDKNHGESGGQSVPAVQGVPSR